MKIPPRPENILMTWGRRMEVLGKDRRKGEEGREVEAGEL